MENLQIELFPMAGDTLANRRSEVTHWDVLVRPEGGDPVEEHEGLTYDQALAKLSELETKYPTASVDCQLEYLLCN